MAIAPSDRPPLASIVLPTYREAENLPIVVPAVAEALARASIDAEILIVDDDSPDDTPAIMAELSRAHPARLIVRRGERGLATAVIRGFREARGEVLVCMDADGSHPPEALPAMIRAVHGGQARFVLGSRYVAGGSTDADWSLLRALNSRVATWLSRPLTRLRDPMSGFFALPRASFEGARDLDPIGYKIALELIVKADCRPVLEIPIAFRDRRLGTSKLDLREILNYVRHVLRLYRYRLTH